MSVAERDGMSSRRFALLDRAMEVRHVDSGMLPGPRVIVSRDGGIAHDSRVGMMGIGRGLDDDVHRHIPAWKILGVCG
jgi:hypothetical protein